MIVIYYGRRARVKPCAPFKNSEGFLLMASDGHAVVVTLSLIKLFPERVCDKLL